MTRHHDVYNQFKKFAEDNNLIIDIEYYESGDLVFGFKKENAWKKKPCFSYPYKDKTWDFDKACGWVLKCLAS